MNKTIVCLSILLYGLLFSCTSRPEKDSATPMPALETVDEDTLTNSLSTQPAVEKLTEKDIELTKDFRYDTYTLEDSYPYKDTTRRFQWEQIKERLAFLENIQQQPTTWAILQNYKNRNGEAPLVKKFSRNEYGRVADTFGTERYQSVPLFLLTDTIVPERYGQDGELTRFLTEEGTFIKAEPMFTGDTWMIPRRYVKIIGDTLAFHHAIFVDRTNQNITTLERTDKGKWSIRSMNPATTGRFRPPYAQKTPLGMFVLQEKKKKMIYLKDGSKERGGFAPYACRFTDGAYIHGVPVNAPRKETIEYSPSLGTTPRSHMCVRNATSHAQFIYQWAPVQETIIFVLE